ncbi:MAG TPA: two-component regulator propeller domain-containing protein [Acidobacteriota bacterium]|nr:two-component regulator propeller domain-containing protein [Acidobacteriota bacterium]
MQSLRFLRARQSLLLGLRRPVVLWMLRILTGSVMWNGRAKNRKSIALIEMLVALTLWLCSHPLRSVASQIGSSRELSNYSVDFWREAQGFPSTRIRNIVQTRDGYLWMATYGGVVRFDGASFTLFNVKTGNLKYDEVWGLKEDKEGGLWIGTYGGGLTLFKDGRFTTFTAADGLPDDAIRSMDVDPEGNVWAGTLRGACRYSHGTFTSFTRKDGLSNDFVTSICAASSQGIFAAAGNKLHRLSDGKFVVQPGVIEENEGRISNLSAGNDGAIWIAFEGGPVKKLKDGLVEKYAVEKASSVGDSKVYEDRQGIVWMGSGDGLRRLRNGRFEVFPQGSAGAGLGVVLSLCLDREGSLWIGLETNGLARLKRAQVATLTEEQGLPHDSVLSAFQDSRGDIWIGTAIGFSKWSGGKVSSRTELNGIPIRHVSSVAEDKDGTVWFGAGGQIFKIMKDGRFVIDPEWKRVFEIKTIYCDPLGRMWIGTDGDGLFRIEHGRVITYRTQEGLASNQVRGILYDRQGTLWVTTFGGGVSRFADGKFTSFTTKDGLGSNRVVAIHQADDDSLWFATRGGLSRLKRGRFRTYTIQEGLPVNQISGILEDGNGNFWFSCSQGLVRVRKTDFKDLDEGKITRIACHTYGVGEGLRSSAFVAGYQPNACRTTDGRLLFASLKGLVVISTEQLFSNALVPPVRIEKVLIDKKPADTGHHVVIPPGDGEVEIHYSALSYLAPEKVQFKYQLEGFDREWVDAGTRRFAYYAGLQAGEYKFRVIACNNDGVWNEAGDVFAFHLRPHYYQTIWFYILCAALALLAAYRFYLIRINRIKAEFAAVTMERNRIAREIHDTMAQGFAGISVQLEAGKQMLFNSPRLAEEHLDEANNLARGCLQEVRRYVWNLRHRDQGKGELAARLSELAKTIGAETSFQFKTTGTPRRLSEPTENILLRIGQEAIVNAVKHARAGRIEVELLFERRHVKLRIQDDGCGFDPDREEVRDDGHFGMLGMRERATQLGGCLTVNTAPGLGTDIEVKVPLRA